LLRLYVDFDASLSSCS